MEVALEKSNHRRRKKVADETVSSFTPPPAGQIRLPGALLPWQAGSAVPAIREADSGYDLAITPWTCPAQRRLRNFFASSARSIRPSFFP